MPVDEHYVKYRVFREPDHDSLKHDRLNPVPMNASFLMEEDQHTETWAEAEEVDGFFFVLRPESDHHARVALAAYIYSCQKEFPNLSADLQFILDSIQYEEDTGEPRQGSLLDVEPEELVLEYPKMRLVE